MGQLLLIHTVMRLGASAHARGGVRFLSSANKSFVFSALWVIWLHSGAFCLLLLPVDASSPLFTFLKTDKASPEVHGDSAHADVDSALANQQAI